MNDVKSIIYRLLYNDRILKSNKKYEGLFEVWWSDENIFVALSCKNPSIRLSCNYRPIQTSVNTSYYNFIYSLYNCNEEQGILPDNHSYKMKLKWKRNEMEMKWKRKWNEMEKEMKWK